MHFGAKPTSIGIEKPKKIRFVKTESVRGKWGNGLCFRFLNSLVFMQQEPKANYYLSIALNLCEKMEISLHIF